MVYGLSGLDPRKAKRIKSGERESEEEVCKVVCFKICLKRQGWIETPAYRVVSIGCGSDRGVRSTVSVTFSWPQSLQYFKSQSPRKMTGSFSRNIWSCDQASLFLGAPDVLGGTGLSAAGPMQANAPAELGARTFYDFEICRLMLLND